MRENRRASCTRVPMTRDRLLKVQVHRDQRPVFPWAVTVVGRVPRQDDSTADERGTKELIMNWRIAFWK